MCGISGIISFQPLKPEHNQLLEKMAETQHHRGPDSRGFARFEKVMFAHNRLSLIDLHERSNQPFKNERYTLIYNGEIYNFAALRSDLEKNYNVVFTGTSDTEVLFYGLIHWGTLPTLKRIKGMFAFAFYDSKEHTVCIARDRIGIKPLFYSYKDGVFCFASELKTLAVNLNHVSVHKPHFMQAPLGTLESTRKYTAFEDIYQVEPGHYLEFKLNEHPQIWTDGCYFRTADWVDEKEWNRLNNSDKNAVQEEFEDLFDRSVASVIVADAGMGAFVSGGIDSSVNAVIAKKHRNVNLYTANIQGKFSEFGDATRLSQSLNSVLHDYKYEPDMFIRDWVKTTWYYDSPVVVHPSAAPFQNVAALASSLGDKAVLTGEGSDELFLGYPRLLTKKYDNLIKSPIQIIQKIYKKIPGLTRYLNLNNNNFYGDIGKMSMNYERFINHSTYEDAFSFLKKDPSYEYQLLTPSMIDNGLHSLLWRNDRMGMMHHIESRFPFLDDDVMKFGVNLPVKFKISRTGKFYNWKHPFLIDKAIVRRLASKHLPDSLVYKKKDGFPMYGQMYVRVDEGLFLNGFWQEQLEMTDSAIRYMCNNIDPYLKAKLASVEIWGRMMVRKESIEQVDAHVHKNARMVIDK